jgi:hypothetical protein
MVSQTRRWNQWPRLFSRRLNSKGGPQLDERQTQGRGQQRRETRRLYKAKNSVSAVPFSLDSL